MRELHVAAVSEDGRHVVLATSKGAAKGGFRVALDDRLAAAVRGDLPRPGEAEPVVVTPKEIQARLRAGESPEQIAAAAGVPLAKVERYAGPVLSERERVLSQARAGFVSRSRLGASALALGEAVDRHLADTTGVRLETVEWSARREEAGTWLVELHYVSQARRRTAAWRYDVARREVTATDSASAALAHVEPGRKPRAVEPATTGSRPVRSPRAKAAPRPVAATSATRTVAARPAAPVRTARPAAAEAREAKRAREEQAAARKAAAAEKAAAAAQAAKAKAAAERKAAQEAERAAAQRAEKAEAAKVKAAKAKAAAEKAAADKAAADKAAAEKAAAEKAAADKAAADKAAAEKAAAEAAPASPPTLRVVGDDEPASARGPKPPPAAARTAPPRAAGQRASVPGWADVLLSTAPVARADEPDEG